MDSPSRNTHQDLPVAPVAEMALTPNVPIEPQQEEPQPQQAPKDHLDELALKHEAEQQNSDDTQTNSDPKENTEASTSILTQTIMPTPPENVIKEREGGGSSSQQQVETNNSSLGIIREERSDDHRDDEDGGGDETVASSTPRRKVGGWKWAFLLLANQALQTLAFFGVAVNLVLFLTRVMDQSNADAANNVSIWTGTVYLFSLIGAFLSDSYWGRYLTCAVFQGILVLGLVLLSIASSMFLIKPKGCGNGHLDCDPASTTGSIIFYIAIYLVALGYGGHQPTLATFGADQFDESDPKERDNIGVFFGYFYFALNSGSLFSNTGLVYLEDNGHWTIGFIVSMAAAIIGLVSYLGGSPRYRYVKAYGNPLPRLAQVFVAAFRKWKINPAEPGSLHEVEGVESAIKGSRKIKHSRQLKCLDKAATVTDDDMVEITDTEQHHAEFKKNPWRLCTVTQVEEAKCVLKMLPIWLCTIIYSVIFTQMVSLFVEQGDVMDTKIGSFHLPAASMSAFDICAVLAATGIYRTVLVPLASRVSGNPQGLTELQRMGVGLVIGCAAMVAAGVTEIYRLRMVVPGQKKSSLHIFWQIPQYLLVGTSEVFMYVGQLEFFNTQAPDGIKSFGSSLCMASISFGNYVSSIMVHVVMLITARGESAGWIPADLNRGHMDRFYYLIAGCAVFDFVVFIFFAKKYTPINFEGGASTTHDGERRNRVNDVEMEINSDVDEDEIIRRRV